MRIASQFEQAILGGILLDNQKLRPISSILSEEDFFDADSQLIFKRMLVLQSENKPVDALTLSKALELHGELERIGGEIYLFDLQKNTYSTTNLEYYAQELKKLSEYRKIARIADELKQKAVQQEDSPQDLLENISKQFKAISAPDTKGSPFHAVSLENLLQIELPARNNILSPWLPEQGIAMIYAPRGIGKTFVALNIAYAVASGGEFLGWKAEKPRQILYLDGEMPASVMQTRAAAIVQSHEKIAAKPFNILTPDLQKLGMPDLSTREGQRGIEPYLEGVELIIVDNISTLCRNGKENEAEAWIPIQEWALSMRASKRSVLFIHHAGKAGQQRGTSKREDILDTVISLKRPADYQPNEGAVFEVHFEKSRGFYGKDAEPFQAKLITQNGQHSWAVSTLEMRTFDKVVSLFNDGLPQSEIAQELEINKSTVSRHIATAREMGVLNVRYA